MLNVEGILSGAPHQASAGRPSCPRCNVYVSSGVAIIGWAGWTRWTKSRGPSAGDPRVADNY